MSARGNVVRYSNNQGSRNVDAKSEIAEVEAFMREYNDLFGKGDTKALWTRVYRFDPGGQTVARSEADLKKLHDDIVAQGYSHSVIHKMKVTPQGPDKMRVKLIAARDQIRQNRQMVELDCHMELPVPIDDLRIQPDYPALIAALEKCEFKSLLQEVREEAGRQTTGAQAELGL